MGHFPESGQKTAMERSTAPTIPKAIQVILFMVFPLISGFQIPSSFLDIGKMRGWDELSQHALSFCRFQPFVPKN